MRVRKPVKEFNPQKVIAVDTETTGLRVWKDDVPFAVSLCDERGVTKYFEWSVDPHTRMVQPPNSDVFELNAWLANTHYEKVFHNSKFDVRMLSKVGVQVEGVVNDTLFAARICNTLEMSYGLKYLAMKHFGIDDKDEKELKELVRRCRLKASNFNRRVLQFGQQPILLGTEAEADYWMPRFYDPTDRLCEKYCRKDTERTMLLWLWYLQQMGDDEHLWKTYHDVELRLWPVVNAMEERGVRIRREVTERERSKALMAKEEHLGAMLRMVDERGLHPFPERPVEYTKRGVPRKVREDGPFNPGSSTQLQRVLYLPENEGGLGLEILGWTKPNKVGSRPQPSTDFNALREHAGHPFVRELLAYRSAAQAINLFFDTYLEMMQPLPGDPTQEVIHPSANQCGTLTGRFSYSDPNLQQVSDPDKSVKSGGNYQARAPFGPRDGYIWYKCDYAQQELRLFASIGKIPFLRNEILAGRDPNTACANKAWGGKDNPSALKAAILSLDLGRDAPSKPEIAQVWERYGWTPQKSKRYGASGEETLAVADRWMSEYAYDIVKAEGSLGKKNTRSRSKCVMFAKIYGGGAGSIVNLIYCTRQEARQFFKEYDDAIPEINQYMDEMVRRARKDGHVLTAYGRKLRVEPEYAYRAVNYTIQGTAADMMKSAIMRVHNRFQEEGWDAHVLLTIHDELIVEVHESIHGPKVLRAVKEIMEDTQDRIELPMEVDINLAKHSWEEKERPITTEVVPGQRVRPVKCRDRRDLQPLDRGAAVTSPGVMTTRSSKTSISKYH